MSELKTGIMEIREEIDEKKVAPYEFSQSLAYKSYFQRIIESRNQRTKGYKFFDDLAYEQDYEMNQQAMNSYLRKKRNDEEVRVNTGTTEKKIEAVVNEIVGMNLQPEIIAFDEEDLEIQQLGEAVGDVVKRTNEIERDEDFWIEAIEELVSQRALFVEEVIDDLLVRGKKRKVTMARKRVMDGRQIYLGDISIPAYLFNKQPYYIKYERMSYYEAQTIYGDWENWQYVKPANMSSDKYGYNYKWRFGSLNDDEVEILHYFSVPDNEWQVIINDVMMLEPKHKLPWEHDGYNMIMVVIKPMSRTFAYGKPLTASAKYLQAFENETIRNLIRKFRQAIEPPTGNISGKVYSKDIWNAGSMVAGARREDFSRLIDHQGVTQSEFAMFDLITRKTEEFIGQNALQNVKSRTSATQIMEMQKQATKMLGLTVYAVMRAKRDMTFLRIYSILEEYIKPIGKTVLGDKIELVYRKFTLQNSKFENDTSGKKVIHFMDKSLKPEDEQAIFKHEENMASIGEPLRIQIINIKELRNVEVFWHVVVNATERDGSALSKAMFTDQLNQGAAIAKLSGRQINADTFIERFETTWKIKNTFAPMPSSQPDQAGGQPALPVPSAGQKPSINSLVRQ